MAQDEDFWRDIREAFTLDRTIVNLNNGGCARARVSSTRRSSGTSISRTRLPSTTCGRCSSRISRRSAAPGGRFGCDAEEFAVTRNASEASQIAQLGIDLKAGDEVLTTNQDYGRMLDTWQQRVRRDGLVLKQISFPVPPPDQADLFRAVRAGRDATHEGDHVCHITNLTGQIFPVRDICRMARSAASRRSSTAPTPSRIFRSRSPISSATTTARACTSGCSRQLAPDFCTCGVPDQGHWALTPANESRDADIRKFEEIGTHPAAMHNAIAEALEFHHSIGGERKAARLRYLRNRWASRLTRRRARKC